MTYDEIYHHIKLSYMSINTRLYESITYFSSVIIYRPTQDIYLIYGFYGVLA